MVAMLVRMYPLASSLPDLLNVLTKLFSFCFLLSSAAALSQEVIIRGLANPSYGGKEVTAIAYDDYISYTRNLLDVDTVKKQGEFSLHFDCKAPRRIYLRCDHVKAPLYIEPGHTYDIGFPDKDSSRMFNPNVDVSGDLSIHTSDSTDLNRLIAQFNESYDVFWRKNYQRFLVKASRIALDSFKLAMKTRFSKAKSAYFKLYIDYSIASTEVSTLESQNFLARDYLYNRPIGYSNNEYMTFFNQFFDKYLYQYALKPEGAQVYAAINESGDAIKLMQALKQAPYLANDTLRELVMLTGLNEIYNNKEFTRSKINTILDQVAKHSRIAEHRQIARNLIARFSTLKKGSPAPGFSLPDKNGKVVSLTDFKGRYVYLSFITCTCTSCISDLKYLEELGKKYPQVQLVTIVTDDTPADMKKMLKANPKFTWVFLNAANAESLKHAYSVFAAPSYYLIDGTGRLILSPACGPFDGTEELFEAIAKKKYKNIKVGEW
jgi:cytochrome oxidase Cu insertion factor (SCO1/SenC/PrrC family)